MIMLKQPTPEAEAPEKEPRYHPGQIVRHRRYGYRGVVVDVDATFCGSDEWYEQVARSRPPKDAPWYHVLVDGAQHMTYVAEHAFFLVKKRPCDINLRDVSRMCSSSSHGGRGRHDASLRQLPATDSWRVF